LDRLRYTTIAHAACTHCMPLSAAKAARLVAALGLAPGNRVLDLGCGKGELLLAIARAARVTGLGLDINADFLLAARRRAQELGLGGAVQFEQRSLLDLPAVAGSAPGAAAFRELDVIAHLGAPLLDGSFAATRRALAARLADGGRLLVSHGYWAREPHPDYLAVLGATRAEFSSHADNLVAGAAAGQVLAASWQSDETEWNAYETSYRTSVETWADSHPSDPEAIEMLTRAHRWHDAFERWGRGTLGNGFYLYRKTAPPASRYDAGPPLPDSTP
jgi:SAM-dependent methyltransferase